MDNAAVVLPVLTALTGPRKLVCIDGPAGAGKTTLAQAIAAQVDSSFVIHMDDWYEGWDRPLKADLFERLTVDVTTPFVQGRSLRLQTWNWTTNEWNEPSEMSPPALLIIEGVGACAAPLRQVADVTVFVDVNAETGLDRVLTRDGRGIKVEMTQWQIHEREFFEVDQTQAHCSLVLKTSE